jgi:hypothetical protein
MIYPFILVAVDVELRPKRFDVERILCAPIGNGTHISAERASLEFPFHDVLVDLRANFFDKPAQVANDGIYALNRMFLLE